MDIGSRDRTWESSPLWSIHFPCLVHLDVGELYGTFAELNFWGSPVFQTFIENHIPTLKFLEQVTQLQVCLFVSFATATQLKRLRCDPFFLVVMKRSHVDMCQRLTELFIMPIMPTSLPEVKSERTSRGVLLGLRNVLKLTPEGTQTPFPELKSFHLRMLMTVA